MTYPGYVVAMVVSLVVLLSIGLVRAWWGKKQ